jgi:hypothetical protein
VHIGGNSVVITIRLEVPTETEAGLCDFCVVCFREDVLNFTRQKLRTSNQLEFPAKRQFIYAYLAM